MYCLEVFVVGHNFWDKLTRPLLDSIHKLEPDLKVILVDNGSYPPYPGGSYSHYPKHEAVREVRYCDNSSLAAAINAGLEMCGEADWYLWLSNDLVCVAPFAEQIRKMEPGQVWYGPRLVHHPEEGGLYYVDDGWMLLPDGMVRDVGMFDERYQGYYYEDIDYAYRAMQAGYMPEMMGLGFEHKGQQSRVFFQDPDGMRERNRAKFLEKFRL